MNWKSFIKDRLIYIMLILFSVITSQILLLPFNILLYIRIYVGIVPLLFLIISMLIEYYHKQKYYQELKNEMEKLEQKYLISEIVKNPDFIEGQILKEILQDTGKSMLENVNEYKYLQEDYKEYIELWIHEVKMPITTSKMIIENNKTEATQSINEELDKIENYIEQALFYARSNTVEKDYYIKKVALKEIINPAVLKNKESLIQNRVNVEIQNIDSRIYTDSKWCIFIVNQIIQNAIKYSKKEERKIEITAEEQKEHVTLKIADNGIGIKQGEIARVFEKGFTGENGRIHGQKSTGIGLYLCKKLCDKLGIGLQLDSQEGIGTEVKMIFPKNSFMNEIIENKKGME